MRSLVQIVLAWLCFCLADPAKAASAASVEHTGKKGAHPGFYLHAGWNYNYPFAAHSWQRADYANMFRFLKELGYDRVMLWPLVETIPPPLSAADARDLHEYRRIVGEADRVGLECWLVFCANLTVRPEAAKLPWIDRTLMPNLRVMHFENSEERNTYLEHRAKIISILNNADGYVTIDGDPGGYAGARPEDFVQIFRADHDLLQIRGAHPHTQKVIPWIWCGWGTRGVWQEPIKPFVERELVLLKTNLPAGGEFLIGQCRSPQACRRINVDLAQELDLTGRSSMICYEAVEYEPSPPAAKLQFDEIRATLREEQVFLNQSRGLFANAQTPLMVLPGIYFFGRAVRDTNYLSKSDAEILKDFAGELGGDPKLLVPAWTCLKLDLTALPADLPAQLRSLKPKGKVAHHIPGGFRRYLEILAAQVDSRIQLLRAIEKPAETPEVAAQRLANGVAALVDWWKQHRYAFEHDQHHPFAWNFADPSQVGQLRAWASQNVAGKRDVMDAAAQKLAANRVMPLEEAKMRIAELCRR
jgi:hypothetical protein